jgi:hypothetical protein
VDTVVTTGRWKAMGMLSACYSIVEIVEVLITVLFSEVVAPRKTFVSKNTMTLPAGENHPAAGMDNPAARATSPCPRHHTRHVAVHPAVVRATLLCPLQAAARAAHLAATTTTTAAATPQQRDYHDHRDAPPP